MKDENQILGETLMSEAKLKAVNPILPASDVRAAVDFYVQKLGFQEMFSHGEPPNYAGVAREGLEIHLCRMDDAQDIAAQTMLRFQVSGIDALYEEMKTSDVLHPTTILKEMVWGTREFTILDLDGVCVTFYEDK